jgi:hypothetical protein
MAGNIERSIRLRPNIDGFLDSSPFDNGEIYYDSIEKTLRVFDGVQQGGFPLLRADLSNISGGGGSGSGTVNFGSKTLQAQAFIGDGSQLTNLPIPPDLATQTFVNNKFSTPATTSTLGTIKVGTGLSITPEGLLTANAISDITSLANLTSLQFVTGVAISEFSSDTLLSGNANDAVPTESAVKTYVDTSIGNLDLDANGIINNGVTGRIAFYAADGNTLSSTDANLTWTDGTDTLSAKNISVVANLTVGNDLSVTGDTTNVGNLTVNQTIFTSSIFDNTTGVVTFSAGTDLILDAAGEINVRGSNISNVATPTEADHAANKAYVDTAASAFQGGTVPGAIRITDTTTSTSVTTGALVVDGGIGTVGPIYSTNQIFVNGSPVLTSLSGGYNGGTISGTLFINNSTVSSNPSSGALRVLGGVGVGRSIYAGGDAFFAGIRFGNGAALGTGFSENIAIGGGSGINAPLNSNVTGVNNIAIGYSSNGQHPDGSDNISIGVNSMANKNVGSGSIGLGTNTLIDSLGNSNIAIGNNSGQLLSSGSSNVIIGSNTGGGIAALNNHVIISDGDGNIRLQFNNNGALGVVTATVVTYGTLGQVLTSQGASSAPRWTDAGGFAGGNVAGVTNFLDTTASTDVNSGAVTIDGGLGVAGAIYAGSIQNTAIGSTTRNSGAFTTLASNNQVTFSGNIASTATSNGTIVVTGGIGVSGAVNVGSSLSSGGVASFTSNTTSTTTSNGAVVVTGGIGVSGDIRIAGSYFGNGSNLTGVVASTATTATNATNVALTTSATSSAFKVPFANTTVSTTGNYGLLQDSAAEFTYNPSTNTLTVGTVSGALSGTATSATQYAGVAQITYSSSIKAGFNISGGGTITVNASGSVLWGTRFIVISNGFGATSSTTGFFDITCPTSGTITGVGSHANVTATAAGITMGAWDALYYILPIGSNNTSLTANFRIATYTAALDVPHTWILIALRNGDDGTFNFCNGMRLRLSESASAALTGSAYPQYSALGVGTAASATTGEIRATNEITAYFSSDRNLKENIVPIENALGKLRQITGVMFDWTDEEVTKRGGEDGYFVRKHDTGIIAQDVEVVLPEVVATREDGYKAVRYEKLAGLIIQSINELADQVDEIKKRLN